jgi:CHAT domain-containing protein
MCEFYRRLIAGETRAGALLNAKLEVRRRGFEDPVFWAAFVCVGDPTRLDEVRE